MAESLVETRPPRHLRSGAPRDLRIDFLRGLSILSVLVLHFNIAYRLLNGPIGKLLPDPYLSNAVWNGNYGVTVFFVISGYLITSTTMRRYGSLDKVSLRGFYAFRFARIFPCLLLVLAIISALAIGGVPIFRGQHPPSLWLADLSILTFWHNALMARFGYFNYCLNVLWSLSVEEVFYLAFPLLCMLLKRARWLALVWAAAVIVGPIFRATHSKNEIESLYGYLACFDAIAMGCGVAVLVRRVRIGPLLRSLLQAAAMAWMLWVFLRAGIDSVPVWGPTMMAVGAALFLFAEGAGLDLAAGPADRFTLPIRWLGRLSYELYLFHIVLLALLQNYVNRHGITESAKLVWFAVFLAASALVAWGMARWYSEPMNGWLRRKLT
ncbi:MAG TPA: acyltransferase [Acidobacteriaceae bacterium]|nr:acyltransferase [Acidobacteriaceae bacterium]